MNKYKRTDELSLQHIYQGGKGRNSVDFMHSKAILIAYHFDQTDDRFFFQEVKM